MQAWNLLLQKKPAHVDSVVIDEADRKKMTDWFWSRPAAEAEKEHEPLLEVRNLTFGYMREAGRHLRDVISYNSTRVKWSAL